MADTTTRCACGQYAPRRADALDPSYDTDAAQERAYHDADVDRHDCYADYHGTSTAPQAGEFEAWEAEIAAALTTEETMPAIADAATLADYQRDYRNGWNASARYGTSTAPNTVNAFEGPLDRADARGVSHAWYDGYHDQAAGRPRWHLLNCEGCDDHEDRISPATRIARAARGEPVEKLAPAAPVIGREGAYEVICMDGNRRHEDDFATRNEAAVFAEWGHCCGAQHEIRQLDDDRPAGPQAPDRAAVDRLSARREQPAAPIDHALAPFTDEERAEIARITRELRAAITAASDALDRLPWASDAERNAAVAEIVKGASAKPADEFADAALVAEAASSILEQTDDYSRAVRVGTLTIGYVQSRGRQAHRALDSDWRAIEPQIGEHVPGADADLSKRSYFYTEAEAHRAVERAFVDRVRSGAYHPKGARS